MLKINNQNELVEGKFVGKNIDKIIIGPDIKYIPENCFNNCKNLNEITFEGNINNIEAAAFMGCENLRIINANNINVIKDFAFHGCNNIVNFNIDENIANNIKYGSYNNSLSTYFELPEIETPFNDLSWRKINLISKKGKAKEYFNVGDEKELQIGSETYHVQILGFAHDDKSDGTGKAGITVGLKEIMTTTSKMNSTNTNVGGWEDSKMRTYLNDTVYNSLPQEVKDIIKPVNKKTSEGNYSTNITTTSDKLFLLSEVEIFGSTTWSASGEGSQYQYFADGGSKIKYQTGSSNYWWERSPNVGYTYYFCSVSDYGGASGSNANNAFGVVFGFSI